MTVILHVSPESMILIELGVDKTLSQAILFRRVREGLAEGETVSDDTLHAALGALIAAKRVERVEASPFAAYRTSRRAIQ